MNPSELSLSVAFSRENLQTEDPDRFTLYASLIRVGFSIWFGALTIILILLILFAPSWISVPFGQTGTTLLGLLSSAISYKIYRISKVSNSTVLTAGRGVAGPDLLWEKSTKTTFRRILSSLITLLLAPQFLYVGIRVFDIIDSSTSSYNDGLLSGLGSGAEFLILISTIAFSVGSLTIAVGCLLLFWSLTTPLRSALVRTIRYMQLQSLLLISSVIGRVSGGIQYIEPEKICNECFNTSFEIKKNNDGQSEYELVCSRCKRLFARIEIDDQGQNDIDVLDAAEPKDSLEFIDN